MKKYSEAISTAIAVLIPVAIAIFVNLNQFQGAFPFGSGSPRYMVARSDP